MHSPSYTDVLFQIDHASTAYCMRGWVNGLIILVQIAPWQPMLYLPPAAFTRDYSGFKYQNASKVCRRCNVSMPAALHALPRG